jgi:hypothetical protein
VATERVTVTPEQVAKAAEEAKAGEQKTERPTWLPEKFESPEALAKAYAELETKQGKPAEKPSAAIETKQPDAAKAAAEAGLDMKALAKEYLANGRALTHGTLEALKAKGITTEAVAQFVAGAEAASREVVTQLAKDVGGEEQLTQIYDWAKANLSADELDAYNVAMDLGNVNLSRITLQGLVAKYQAAVGTNPSLVNGSGSKPGTGQPAFQSNQEVIAAMSDPKYKTDEAYRQAVAKRLQGTNLFSIRG